MRGHVRTTSDDPHPDGRVVFYEGDDLTAFIEEVFEESPGVDIGFYHLAFLVPDEQVDAFNAAAERNGWEVGS